jgi:L-fuconolactonase
MPTIDAHIHFWNYDPVRDSWITEEMAVIRRNFTPKDAQKVFAENDVAGCIAVQADQSDHETHYLLQLARENDFIKGVVGWVDFNAHQLEKTLIERLQAYHPGTSGRSLFH